MLGPQSTRTITEPNSRNASLDNAAVKKGAVSTKPVSLDNTHSHRKVTEMAGLLHYTTPGVYNGNIEIRSYKWREG